MFSPWNVLRVFRPLHLLACIGVLCVTLEFVLTVLAGPHGVPERKSPQDSMGFQARFERLVGAEHLSDSTSTTEREEVRENGNGSGILTERFRRIVEIELDATDHDVDIEIQPFGREARILRRKHRVPRGHLALGIVPPAALFSQVLLGKRVKAEILETASPQSVGTPPNFTTGRSFGSGNTPVQPSPPYFPPFSPSWYSFANFFSGSQDTTPVEDYPEGPVTVPPFAEFSSASAPSSPASLLPALSPAEGAPAEGGTTGETVADGEVSASFVDSPPKRRRISPSTLQPLKFRPLGAAAAPLAAASPAFETGGGAPGADWGLQRQTSGLWSEAGSDALRAVVTHPGAITLSAVATAAAALVVGTRLWRVWRSRGRRSEHLLDAHTASWDLGRCLLLVDVAAARESGALRGSFVPGSAQVSVNWAHQLATISFKFIPSASKGLFSFIARRGVRAHQRFRVPMEDCFISPQREKAESGEAFLLAEGAAAGGGFFDEAAASKSSSLASTTAAADWSESGSATLAKKGALLSQPRSNSNKKRGGGPRAEDLARLDPASFVREHVQRSIFGSKTTALVVKFDANPGPAPLQRLPNPHATLPPSLVQRVQEQLALPSAPDVQLEGEAPVGAEEKRRALSGLLPRRPPHAKQSRLSYVAAWDSAVSDALCSWDLAVDDSQPLGVWADLATQTLFVAQAPETSGGCLHALRGKFGRAAPNASGVLFHEIPLSEACALASTAHAGFSVAFVRVPFQETLLSAPKTAAADNAAPAQRTAESPRAIQSAETGAAAAAKSDSFNQQAGEASGGGFRLFQHVRIELRPCPRAFHKRTLPKLAPKVVGD